MNEDDAVLIQKKIDASIFRADFWTWNISEADAASMPPLH
jgi:hypothetical protein